MAVGNIAKSMLGFADDFIEGASKGVGNGKVIKASVNALKSNKSEIQKGMIKKVNAGHIAGDFLGGGVRETVKNVKKGDDIFKSIEKAHSNADGSLNMKRAAGTFVAGSAAARIATGGGIYKDRYGNPNLIGLPFI